MIRKSGYRFSEKIMLKQRDEIMIRSDHDLGQNMTLARRLQLMRAER